MSNLNVDFSELFPHDDRLYSQKLAEIVHMMNDLLHLYAFLVFIKLCVEAFTAILKRFLRILVCEYFENVSWTYEF